MIPFGQEHFDRFVDLVFKPAVAMGGCVEFVAWGGVVSRKTGRIIKAEYPKCVTGGWFNNPDKLLLYARTIDGVSGYVTFNPVRDIKLSQIDNKVDRFNTGDGTDEADILATAFFLIDIDVDRGNEKVSATAGELNGCIEVRNKIWDEAPGVAEGAISGVSGNGCYILARAPAAPKAKVKRVLAQLAEVYGKKGRDAVHVDVNPCFTNAHIGLPGTLKCKGSSTVSRPFRLVTIDRWPGQS
jgi:hypothetical protein